MSERNTYEQAGDWMVGAMKRNPEALLVLAAGCALLMRSKSSGRQASPGYEGHYYQAAEQSAGTSARAYASDAGSRISDATSRVARTVSEYASDVGGRVAETASTVSDYAGQMRERVAAGASRLPEQARSTVQSGFARILREQPLAIAAMGLAAGATLAAIFPASETENQVLGPAHDAVVDAASRVADNVKSAAGEAGEQLKQTARERGLDPEGLKGLARDVAGKFADNVAGRSAEQNENRNPDQNESPGLVPEHFGTRT